MNGMDVVSCCVPGLARLACHERLLRVELDGESWELLASGPSSSQCGDRCFFELDQIAALWSFTVRDGERK